MFDAKDPITDEKRKELMERLANDLILASLSEVPEYSEDHLVNIDRE